jgi:hypothetical protein
MANPDARFGLMPVGTLSGSPWQASVRKYNVSSSYATALFIGDPVDFDTTASNIATAARYPYVIRSAFTNGTYSIGAIVAVEPDPDNLTRTYSPASTAAVVHVCTAPDAIYRIRDDGGAILTNVALTQNAVGIFTHSGDTVTGLSGMELDAGTTDAPAADASNTMLILGLADISDNEFDGSTDTRMVWEVMINMHRFKQTGDGDGALGVTAS